VSTVSPPTVEALLADAGRVQELAVTPLDR
jgi:hypothetical protein